MGFTGKNLPVWNEYQVISPFPSIVPRWSRQYTQAVVPHITIVCYNFMLQQQFIEFVVTGCYCERTVYYAGTLFTFEVKSFRRNTLTFGLPVVWVLGSRRSLRPSAAFSRTCKRDITQAIIPGIIWRSVVIS